MSDKIQISGSGIGLGGVLFIVFLILKLGVGNTAVMGWSWWWVCSPLWLPIVLVLGIMVLFLGIGGICLGIKALLGG